ncbi:DUF3459 domain-containing protein, partial [Streptomyces sp. NPDC048606]|uniref:DUF3459 domain-containing protein n=1 Tax=Streptomyces sp. NPDC048606 TaxID=3154726 RepID=UPI00341EE1F6
WLPQPAEWAGLSVAAQTGDPHSTLELYRAALRIRRQDPDLGAGDAVTWLDAPAGTLAFRRGGFVCTVNTTGEAVRITAPGAVLLASGAEAPTGEAPAGGAPAGGAPVADEEGFVLLDADTTVWWRG